jgi:hypothetical protein
VRSDESEVSLMGWRIAVYVDRRDFPTSTAKGTLGGG